MRTSFLFILASSLTVTVASTAFGSHPDDEDPPAVQTSAESNNDDSQQTQEPPEEEQEPVAYHEVVVVTASKTEQSIVDAVSMVTSLASEDLRSMPSLVLDDQLRRIPGFSLLRRSSSLTSHPTTQGVSLRGIGPSGASRSLVLWDGIPLNDPFGNWVYWNRLPGLSLESIEVSRGATSQLYGSSALGGTIQLRPRAATEDTFELRGQFGNRDTYDFDVFASDRIGEVGVLAAARLFDSEGFIKLREQDRGLVDIPAGTSFQSFLGRAEYGGFHVGVNAFHEDRSNGTPIQQNDSNLVLFETGVDRDQWTANFYAQRQEFNNKFSRIVSGRSNEFLTAEQQFESIGLGSSVAMRTDKGLQFGLDWRYVSWGELNQNFAGVFVQQMLTPSPKLDVLLGGRFDVWENNSTQGSFNPRLGVLYRATSTANLRASVYRGFRGPSLNELYRPFRVGAIRTAANDELTEETLLGAEAGVDFYPSRDWLVRLNGFWNSLRDPVANVTLEINDEGIFRQRQNLGEVNVRGLEVEASYRLSDTWSARGAYLFSSAIVDETDLRVPQVPKHQGNLGIRYEDRVVVFADVRFASDQFEDDRNTLPLEGFGVVDVSVKIPLLPRFGLYVGVENLFDVEYQIARTPVVNIGTPRLVHGGIEIRVNP